jgi:hypothetical protein
MTRILILLASLLWMGNTHAAEWVRRDGGLTPLLFLEGEIVKGDYKKLTSLIVDHSKKAPITNLFLNSTGGDVLEAMKIGKLIRKLLLFTKVLPLSKTLSIQTSTCDSACFLILVAGVDRLVAFNLPEKSRSRVSIHRPYIDPSYFSGLSSVEASDLQNKVMNLVEEYLREMGVSTSLIEEMLKTPSYKAKKLDEESFEKHIGSRSSGYEEWIVAKCGPYPTQNDETTNDLCNSSLSKVEVVIHFCSEYSEDHLRLLKLLVPPHQECRRAATREDRLDTNQFLGITIPINGRWEFVEFQPFDRQFINYHVDKSAKVIGKTINFSDGLITLPDGTTCQFISMEKSHRDFLKRVYDAPPLSWETNPPTSTGYSFGNLGITEFFVPIVKTDCRENSQKRNGKNGLLLDEIWIANKGKRLFMTWDPGYMKHLIRIERVE